MKINRLYFLKFLVTVFLLLKQNPSPAQNPSDAEVQEPSLYEEDSLRKAKAASSSQAPAPQNNPSYTKDNGFPDIGRITVQNHYYGYNKTQTTNESVPIERVPIRSQASRPENADKAPPAPAMPKTGGDKKNAQGAQRKNQARSKAKKSKSSTNSSNCCPDDYGSIGRQKFDLAIFTGGGIMYSVLANLYTADSKLGEPDFGTMLVEGMTARFGGGIKLNIGSEKKFFFLNAAAYSNLATEKQGDLEMNRVGLDFRGQFGIGYVLGNPRSKWFYASKLIGLDLTYLDLTPMLAGHVNMPGSAGLDSIATNMKQMAIGAFTGVRFTEHVGDRHVFSQGLGISLGPSFFTGNTGHYSNNIGMAINLMLFFEHNIRMTENMFFRWFVESDNSFNLSFSPRIPIDIGSVNMLVDDVKDFISKIQVLTATGVDGNGNPIQGGFGSVLNSVSALTNNVQFITTLMERYISDLFASLSANIEESVGSSLGAIVDKGLDFVKDLGDLLNKEVLDKITKPILEQDFGTAQSIFKAIDAISGVIKNLPDIMDKFGDKISSGIGDFGDTIKDELQKISADIFDQINISISAFTKDLRDILNGVLGVGLEGIAISSTDTMMSGYLQDYYLRDINTSAANVEKLYAFLSMLEDDAATQDVLDDTKLGDVVIKKNPEVGSSGDRFYEMSYKDLADLIKDNINNNTTDSSALKVFERATTDIMLKYIPIRSLSNYFETNGGNPIQCGSFCSQSFSNLVQTIYNYNKGDPSGDASHQAALDAFKNSAEAIFPDHAKEIMDFVDGLTNITSEQGLQEAIDQLLQELGGLNSSAGDLLASLAGLQIANPGFSAGVTAYPRVNVGVGFYWMF